MKKVILLVMAVLLLTSLAHARTYTSDLMINPSAGWAASATHPLSATPDAQIHGNYVRDGGPGNQITYLDWTEISQIQADQNPNLYAHWYTAMWDEANCEPSGCPAGFTFDAWSDILHLTDTGLSIPEFQEINNVKITITIQDNTTNPYVPAKMYAQLYTLENGVYKYYANHGMSPRNTGGTPLTQYTYIYEFQQRQSDGLWGMRYTSNVPNGLGGVLEDTTFRNYQDYDINPDTLSNRGTGAFGLTLQEERNSGDSWIQSQVNITVEASGPDLGANQDFPAIVQVLPANPKFGDTLRCDIDYATLPETYSRFRASYAWYSSDGDYQPFGIGDRLENCSWCTKGKRVFCLASIQSTDGQRMYVTSKPRIIQNTPPEITFHEITPSHPTDGVTVECSWSATDVDGDTVTAYNYTWGRKQQEDFVWGRVPDVNINRISSSAFTNGRYFRCILDVTDGQDISRSTATSILQQPSQTPSRYSGYQNENATAQWVVNYGEISIDLEQFGSIRKDELGIPTPVGNGTYMVFVNTTCIGGECGDLATNLEQPIPYGWENISGLSSLSVPVGLNVGDDYIGYPTTFVNEEIFTYTRNPQRGTLFQRYPFLSFAGIPNLTTPYHPDWNYYASPDCFNNTSPLINTTCLLPYAIKEYSPNRQNVSPTFPLFARSTVESENRFARNVNSQRIPTIGTSTARYNLSVPTIPFEQNNCADYTNFTIHPRNYTTSVGDRLNLFAFAYDTYHQRNVDVTHLVDFVSSHPDIISVDDINDHTIYFLQESSSTVDGRVAITGLFCGQQDIRQFTVEPITPSCPVTFATFGQDGPYQQARGNESKVVELLGAVGFDLQNIDSFPGATTQYTIEGVVTNDVRIDRFDFNDCDHYTQICATHAQLAFPTGGDPACDAAPLRRTVSLRTIPSDFCAHFRDCGPMNNTKEWISEELANYYGNYAEFTREPVLNYLETQVTTILNDYVTVGDFRNVPLGLNPANLGICNSVDPTVSALCTDVPAEFAWFNYRYNNTALGMGAGELTVIQEQILDGITKFLLTRDTLMFNATTDPIPPADLEDPVNYIADNVEVVYQACVTDTRDVVSSRTACQRCVANGREYESATLDIDRDGDLETCNANPDGTGFINNPKWNEVELSTELPACDVAQYQTCSENGANYIPDSSIFYLSGPEHFGWWCKWNQTTTDYEWYTWYDRGINLTEVQNDQPVEICTDGLDNNCNMYDSFQHGDIGNYDFSRYNESGAIYPVVQYSDNLDRFDPACWSNITVNVTNATNGQYLENAIINIAFRAGNDVTTYNQGVTNVNGSYDSGKIPASDYRVEVSYPGCTATGVFNNIQLNVSQHLVLNVSYSCTEGCGNSILDGGEECDIDPLGDILISPSVCPVGFDTSGITGCTSSCTLEGTCQPQTVVGDVECPDGKNLVIVRRPVVTESGDQVTLAIATCAE